MELLSQNNQNQKWYNWINDFGDRIKTLRNDDLDIEERKKFLVGIVDKIIVKTKDKETHSLDVIFQSPFVDDTLKWNSKGNPKK